MGQSGQQLMGDGDWCERARSPGLEKGFASFHVELGKQATPWIPGIKGLMQDSGAQGTIGRDSEWEGRGSLADQEGLSLRQESQWFSRS